MVALILRGQMADLAQLETNIFKMSCTRLHKHMLVEFNGALKDVKYHKGDRK